MAQRTTRTQSRPSRAATQKPPPTIHIAMEPLEFMQRLAALVPRPKLHLICFPGVHAPKEQREPSGGPPGAGRISPGRGGEQASWPDLRHDVPPLRAWPSMPQRREVAPGLLAARSRYRHDLRRRGALRGTPTFSEDASFDGATFSGDVSSYNPSLSGKASVGAHFSGDGSIPFAESPLRTLPCLPVRQSCLPSLWKGLRSRQPTRKDR